MRVREAVTSFLSDRERNDCAAGTVQNYRSQFHLLADWLEAHGAGDLSRVTPRLLADYVEHLKTRPKMQGGRGGRGGTISKVTIRKRAKAMRTFFRWCEAERLVEPIARCVPVPKAGRRLPKALSEWQMQRLLAAKMGQRERAAIALMYDAGPRLSEVVALNVGDVCLDECRAYIGHGKGDKARHIVFGIEAGAELCAWLEERAAWLKPCRPTEALFLNQYGDRMSADALYRSIKAVGESVELGREVRPHVLRHTFATHALNNDAPITDLQQQLGHEHIETTLIYASVALGAIQRRHAEYSPLKKAKQTAGKG